MKVCLDYQPAVAQRAGIGRYTRELARHLATRLGAEDRLRLFYLDFRGNGEAPDIPGAEAAPWRRLPGAWLQQCWKRLSWPDYASLAGKADLYHFTNFIIPPLKRGRAIATIFDMSFARLPQCAEAKNLVYLRSRMARTIARADAIVTISQFSADEIAAFHPEAAGKLHVTPLGIDPRLKAPAPRTLRDVRQKLKLERPYILSLGTIEPRKNFPFVVKVFDLLERHDLDLVIAGMPGWQCEPIFDSFRKAKRAGRIRYLRYVPDADLPALYAGAEMFVLASLYEGFGFPPLEAMACGTPVVASSGGSLPEVLGEGARIMPDFDVDAWREAIDRLLRDRDAAQSLAQRGLARSAGYRWETTAEATLRLYRTLSASLEGEAG